MNFAASMSSAGRGHVGPSLWHPMHPPVGVAGTVECRGWHGSIGATMIKALAACCVLVAALAGCGRSSDVVGPDPSVAVKRSGWVRFERAAFSADGTIAFIGVDDDNDPCVGRASGGRPKDVSPDGIEPTDFAWMPDGKSLLMSDRSPDGSGDRLAVYDLSGKRLRVIPTDFAFQLGNGMTVRSDAEVAIAAVQVPSDYEERKELLEIDLGTGVARALTATPEVDESYPQYLDDGRLVFLGGRLVSPTQGPNGWAGVLDPASGNSRQLTPESEAVMSATVVADGRGIVYSAFPPPRRHESALWYVSLEGGGPTKLFAFGAGNLASLKNSNTIMYPGDAPAGGKSGIVTRAISPPS